MTESYDSSWDLVRSSEGNLPGNRTAYDRKSAEWANRNWMEWLNNHLSFPFEVKRVEDDDDAYFTDIAEQSPFRLGHVMQALSIDSESARRGIIVQAREGGQLGTAPLCDLEVTSKQDPNYWPVREYAVWDANK